VVSDIRVSRRVIDVVPNVVPKARLFSMTNEESPQVKPALTLDGLTGFEPATT
jgi:hypothetical protein